MFQQLFTYTHDRYRTAYDRERYENILRDPDSAFGKKLNFIIGVLIIISVLIIVFESIPEVSSYFSFSFFLADILISLIFAAEYSYRFMRAKKKIDFALRPLNMIDFLSFAPFFFGLIFQAFAGLDILKVLRLLRMFRLFEISTHSPIALGFFRTLKEYRNEYKAIWIIFISLLFIISSLVYFFEKPVNSEFATIPHALWWWIVTMATVGYGDMAPITLWGRLLWVVLILLGPVLLAVMSSITILVFMDVSESQKQILEKMCFHCHSKSWENALYCYHCWSQEFTNIIQEENSSKMSFIKKLFGK